MNARGCYAAWPYQRAYRLRLNKARVRISREDFIEGESLGEYNGRRNDRLSIAIIILLFPLLFSPFLSLFLSF